MQDDDRQTQETFDSVTGEAMALTPPRVEDQEAGRREANRLTLESVPFFNRPIHSRSDDRIVGQDEFGRPVYETVAGNRYTISLSPDQRTTRARIEEDVVPAIQSYMQDPSLPTVQQVTDFAVGAVKGAYESLEGSMQGRGTYGDVFGLAVGSGAGSMFGEVPEGAIRLFGGFRAAKSPAVDAEGRALPQSIGADTLPRFEMDDSSALFFPNRLPQQNVRALDNRADRAKIEANPGDYFARLDQILDHPELFRQYPQFADLRVVEDVSIDKRSGGYYNPDLNLLAVSPSVARSPEWLGQVLLHEVQHAIQEVEGFDRGTNPRTSEVLGKAQGQLEEARQLYEGALQVFNDYDFNSKIDDIKIFTGRVLDDIEQDGIVSPQDITFTSPHRANWTQSIEDFSSTLGMDPDSQTTAYDTVLDFYAMVRDNPSLLSPKDAEEFENLFGISVDKLSDLDETGFLTELETLGAVPLDPQRVRYSEQDILDEVYRSRSGEVEARNVQERLALNLAERFQRVPVSMEDTPRPQQWRVERDNPPATGFNTGGVVDMERQMSLFDMGGLTDDGAMRDPVSGNEVPPGSMASEVRDDVPAMLSEGEYIVPADVVRFFGVKFFEDLRGQAKSGLRDMEQDGRIGGEPVGAPQDDLTPEEMAMLAEITGMAMGGVVRKGYQEGGVVAPMTQQNFLDQAQQAGGFQLPTSVFAPSQPTSPTTPAFTPVTLYGPAGEVMLATSQDQSNQLLSQGYTTQPRPVLVAPTPADDSRDRDPSMDTPEVSGGSGFSLNDENLESLRTNPLSFGTDALNSNFALSSRQMAGAGSLLGGMPGMIAGGLAGAAMELDNIAKAKAGLEIARSRNLEGTPEFTALSNSIDTAVKNLSGPARVLERLGLGSGNSYAEQARTAGTTTTATPAPARRPTVGSAASTATTPDTTPRPTRDVFAGLPTLPPAREGRDGEAAETTRQTAAKKVAASEGTLRDDGSFSRTTPEGKETFASKVSRGGGFEKGGLVARPSRKKPVAKKK